MKSKTRTLTTKALSLLLSLALMLGLMPVMSLTASAEEYSFRYAYDCQRQPAFPKKGETCSTRGFQYPLISWRNSGTTNEGDWKLTYLGSYKDKSNVSPELPGIASSVQSAYSLSSTDEIPIYELKNGTNHIAYGVLCALANNNEEALFIGDTWPNGGGYVLSQNILSGTVSFKITKDITDIENDHTASHTHNFTYSANGATITAVCTNAGCSLTGGKVSFTLAAPGANLVYDGTAKKATIEGAEAFSAATGISVSSNNIVYNYTPFGGNNGVVVTETKNAGQYQALYTLQTTTLPNPFAGVGFTINKAGSVPANVTANNSTYNGSAQALVTAGTATGGTMQYKLGADGTYSENIPKATDANKYTVYYKVKGDNNHNDSAENSVSVTIAPKEIGITWPADTERFFEHDGNPHSLTATATGLVNSDTCNVTVTGERTDIGTYTATATGVSNSNYKLPTTGLTASFTIYPSLSDLWNAIGDEVWTGYGEQTGVISYSKGDEPNEFRASFMGGKYTFDVPFGNMRFNPNSLVNNFDQGIYAFDIDLPAVTGMSSETLGVKFQNGEIYGISSQNAGIAKMGKENDVSAWNDLAEALKAGGFVKLTQDITAESGDRVLTVPFDKTVVLDLNGHKIDRALSEAIENGSVIVNNGTLAIVDGKDGGMITGGNTIGNGGGIRNNGALTLYGGEITGNNASSTGGGVYNSAANTSLFGFWMTGGLIDGNTANKSPAIGGDVTFNNMAVIQINADGATVSTAKAKEGMEGYDYIKPVMPDNEKLEVLSELYKALGDEVWTGYGEQTGVISYSRGDDPNEFRASFMGGTYTFDVPFIDITSAEKTENGDGSFTYSLEVPLPAQTGLASETLKVTVRNGKITDLVSENAGLDMSKEESDITSWSALQSAMAKDGVIKLTQDITAGNNDTALTVPDSKTVVLDLNGHTIDRALTAAAENGSVIINNGTLAIMDSTGGKITGGNTTGNGGGIVNNGTLTLYGGKITGNKANGTGGGVYNSKTNTETTGFWMTGGLIDGNTATTNPAISGDVTFNNMAVVQINADGATVSTAKAKEGMEGYDYIKPVMPDNEKLEVLSELYKALGEDVWTGYGEKTGVISYSRGDEPNEFRASFMGGTYTFDVPFIDITSAEKTDNGDGSFTYLLEVPLPAQTGLASETLKVTVSNGKITDLVSENAGLDMSKESDVSEWSSLAEAMANGGVIKLTQNITAGNHDTALTVPEGKTVVLDLNGHTIDRALSDAIENGSVIINNGTLAIMDSNGGKITGGNTTGNGGGIVNNGTLTLYGGEITGNNANGTGGGVYNSKTNTETTGFWMTGGLIDGNTATTNPAISGDVTFNNMAVVQINADGATVSTAKAKEGMEGYDYIKPVMPDNEKLEVLSELYKALGEDVWTGYGEKTGVISYSRGDDPNEFRASFMGGTYTFDVPFIDITSAEKTENGDGSFTYSLEVPLPAQTGLASETLKVTVSNGKITDLVSENAGLDMSKEESDITSWSALQSAMANGGVIKLTQDITAGNNDTALTVPDGKTVVLDLNGHKIDRALSEAIENGSVIINNGTLAIMDNKGGKITGGNTTGNGGGIVNNGTLTLYGGEITGNKANGTGGGVYNSKENTETTGFWMTGGLIDGNTATTNPAISGDVTFNNMAVVQINADGATVSTAKAKEGMEGYDYIKPVMPDNEKLEVLSELYKALGEDVWTGYGEKTGVISYSRGDEPNEFRASFMGGTYTFDVPFIDITSAEKTDNGDGSFTYLLEVPLPAQTGLASETLKVTVSNGKITDLVSENAGLDMSKESDVSEWSSLAEAMAKGGVIKLTQNITAGNHDTALTVPEGKTVVLDLNGYTIDRALTAAAENGSVIINNGTLAIMDSNGGKITGGNTTGNGGGIVNNGTLTLYGGEITGNNASGTGGGVYNSEENTETTGFWMTGGLIDGNTANKYPAISGDVTFNNMAVIQISAEGKTVSVATAKKSMANHSYIKPIMPDYEDYTTTPEDGGDKKSSHGSSGSSSSSYAVSTSKTTNGTIKASTYNAVKGTKVTLTVTPKDGYEIDTVTVTDKDGNEVEVTKNEDGTFSYVQPASKVTVDAIYKEAGAEPTASPAPTTDTTTDKPSDGDAGNWFKDVPETTWYYAPIKEAFDAERMSGMSEDYFEPETDITRGMFAYAIYRREGLPETDAQNKFEDVMSATYYEKAIAWATENGIVAGIDDTHYAPDDQITREQMAAILYRYAQFKAYDVSVGEDTNILDFTDVQDISQYAVPAIQWAVGDSVITGFEDGTMRPKANANRAQMAVILNKIADLF